MKRLTCQVAGKDVKVGWVNFIPSGISFGLADRTFIVPRMRVRNYVWNAYNRVQAQFVLTHDVTAMEAVTNPHFTFHPAVLFHLRADGDDPIFEGIVETLTYFQTFDELQWIRAVSAPLGDLKLNAPRQHPDLETWTLDAPSENASVYVAVDLQSMTAPRDNFAAPLLWYVEWQGYVTRIAAWLGTPLPSTLSWFYQW